MPMKMYDACKRRLPLELFPVEQQHAQPSNQLQTHRPIDSRTISGLGGENVIHDIELIFGEVNFLIIRKSHQCRSYRSGTNYFFP